MRQKDFPDIGERKMQEYDTEERANMMDTRFPRLTSRGQIPLFYRVYPS